MRIITNVPIIKNTKKNLLQFFSVLMFEFAFA